MRWYVIVVKALETALILAPIVYGLCLYGWDVQSMMVPSYKSPGMGFSVGDAEPVLFEDLTVINVSVTNTGECPITVTDFQAPVLYRGNKIGEAYLRYPVSIPSGETAYLIIVVELSNATLSDVVELPGRLRVKLMGLLVEAPLNITVSIWNIPEDMRGR